MKAGINLRAILVAALVGGIAGSVVLVVSMAGAISASHVGEVATLGGVVGAFFAIGSSAVIALFGTVGRYAILGTGFAALGRSGYLLVFGHGGAVYCAVGLALFAGALADSITRRAGMVGAAGTVFPAV